MAEHRIELLEHGIFASNVLRNPPPALLYEDAIHFDEGMIADSGAINAKSGAKTGRSPKDKRIVESEEVRGDVWWGPVNMPLSPQSYRINRKRAVDYLSRSPRLYVIDGFAGWDPEHRLKVRVVCSRPYHALFMYNMLIRPTAEELADFGTPDYTIYNAGSFPADPEVEGVTSDTSVTLSFEHRELVILGTEYAGEMKKGIFTVMHYLMPKRGVLSMHCSANEGTSGDVSLFFGLSGTGKTTLSADPRRQLIGDDEHCWTDRGVFNIEGGCYAKCIGLAAEKEPEIWQAIRFGTVLENVVIDSQNRRVDYADNRLTENTRASYPIDYIDNAKIPCLGGQPRNIILLTCDAFGVLPPVAKLTPAQAMYHFISGYTAKVAGTEVGVKDPEATFSACYGAAFLVWHPMKYAQMLADKMQQHAADAWLINTGWTGGAHGSGSRIKLAYTRAIIDAIHSGELAKVPTETEPVFGLSIPNACPGVPETVLQPRSTWSKPVAYDAQAQHLAKLFQANFANYADQATAEVRDAGPRGPAASQRDSAARSLASA
ncbi:MAG: phosphoenolpyruvate carboxykinase (ATP) [Pirellulaceae bacterium]|jgi:phosphoenolpyruvate carboxykinase (ATP)|nr:phosphoenolpyruvate carboxykinase (ATP) [Pirellulaceae bacterium]